ncbi:hypothetical protein HRD49_20180 [Corallococcus exiguus]|uniref:hypothetical protein n=1 Tax=Corallococcus exiguus TaxID=83462 RepID=UPI00155F7286|nr:hypothetical protein [Corallococcus exiguus]NRD64077.1 hypothetical protein [Corallococcus exiguus]
MQSHFKHVVLTALLTGCGGVGMEANEATTSPPAAHELVTTGNSAERHCVASVQVLKPGEPLPDTVTVPTCFDTFSEAFFVATRGAVRLPATAKPADLQESDLKRVTQFGAGETVVGMEFTEANWNGNSCTFISSSGGCGSYFVNLPAPWNDAFSSSRTFGGCNHAYHYENYDGPLGGGAQIDCGWGCSYIGAAMDKRTSSIFWTQ